MNSNATIACSGRRHNQTPFCQHVLASVFGGRNPWFGLASAASLIIGSSLGCARFSSTSTPVPTWELANAQPIESVPLGRARVSFDRPLPARLIQELSPEFSLVTIRSRRDWEEVRRRLDLSQAPSTVDFSQGVVVGLVASVGESVGASWPIPIHQIRCREGQGCLEASFVPGLYHPLLCPSYVELVYAPGVRAVKRVHISHRKFVIPAPSKLD